MIKNIVKNVFERSGIYIKWQKNIPHGIDWMLDVDRISKPGWQPKVIFDVGANIGQTSLKLAKQWPSASIHAFEPVQSTCEKLERNVRHLPNVTAHRIGLGAAQKQMTIPVIPVNEQNSLKSDRVHNSEEAIIETLHVDTVERFCASKSVTSIDILKTDTEGYDIEVLRGAMPWIGCEGIPYVLSEVSFLHNDQQHTSFSEVHALLADAGYLIVGFYETRSLVPRPRDSYCNALYARGSVLR